jgi:hypothetical protein
LRYSVPEGTGVQDKCIDVPFSTQFRNSEDNPLECGEIADFHFTKIDSAEGIKKGQYLFSSPSSVSSYPIVCSYIKD